MGTLRGLPLRHKVTALAMLTSGLVLTLACLSLVVYDLRRVEQDMKDDLLSLASVLGSNSTAALAFDDPRAAGEVLAALSAKPHVVSACLYGSSGRPFAEYRRRDAQAERPPARPLPDTYGRVSGHVVLFQKVTLGEETAGTIYLKADLGQWRSRIKGYALVVVLVMLASLVLAVAVTTRLQRHISDPIVRLTTAAASVAHSKDYSVRVETTSGGELGILTAAFNDMLSQIQQRDDELRREAREREWAQQALRASEGQFRSIVETTSEWIWSVDAQGRSTYDNPAVERILGYSTRELLGRKLLDLLHPDDRAHNEGLFSQLARRKKGFNNLVLRMRAMDGAYRTLQTSGVPILDAAGNLVGLQGSARDMTEGLLLEEQLRQSQKMEAVGRLAGGVAHDFNNLLSVILGYGELIARSDLAPAARRKVEQILKAGDRAAGLTRQLLAFSRKQVLAPKVLDLNALVADFAKMLPRVLREDIELVLVPAPELGQVKADPGQIEQILMNLVVNGRDAMPEGGRIEIATANVTLDETGAEDQVGGKGLFVMLSVTDTGCGMDAQTQARAFDPFFTTKDPGQGTGLGLATVYGIVKQSEGHIALESAPGKGTTLRVYLPRMDMPAEQSVATPAEPARQGSETILLVEDEPAVRELVTEMLTALGHTVLAADSGVAALENSERHAGPIHLLLSDVVMPGISGRQVAEEVRRRRPETKVVYMSGHTDEILGAKGVLDPDTMLLSKPFTGTALTECLREVLG